MEYILSSDQHKFKNNCLKIYFSKTNTFSKSIYIVNINDIL